MNSSLKILVCLFIILCADACSHSTTIRFNHGNSDLVNFTSENKDFIKKTSANRLHLRVSKNTVIDVDIKSIAGFVQPSDIDQNKRYWPDDYDLQPWAFCSIYF